MLTMFYILLGLVAVASVGGFILSTYMVCRNEKVYRFRQDLLWVIHIHMGKPVYPEIYAEYDAISYEDMMHMNNCRKPLESFYAGTKLLALYKVSKNK